MRGFLLALLFAAALAGCAGEAPGAATDETAGAPAEPTRSAPTAGPGSPEAPAAPEANVAPAATATLPSMLLTQTGCDSFYSMHSVDAAYADARLPEGLAPYPYQQGVLFALKAWTCAGGEADGGEVGESAATVYYLAVEPDAAYDAEHVDFSWYPVEIVTSSAQLAAAFRDWGFDPVEADVAIEWNRGFDPWLVSVASAGRSAVDATIAITAFGDMDESNVRYFAGDGKRVLGAVDIVVHEGADGGNGPTLLRIDGPDAPSPLPLVGTSSFQGWDEGALSYTWTGVRFA